MDKKEIILKLKALSERGINGEKENATKLLEKLMNKYGISEEEILEDEIKEVRIELRSDIEVRLASQILYAFFNNASLYKSHNTRVQYYTQLTSSQEIEFKYMFSIYLEDFKKQQLIFYRAFINKNKIFPKECNRISAEDDEISSEERKEIILSQIMAEGIEFTRIRKALN